MMEPWIAKLEEPLRNVLIDSGMDKDEIDIILLVGGSTKIPAVKAWLAEWMELDEDAEAEKFYTKVDPDIAVAEGATIMAGLISE